MLSNTYDYIQSNSISLNTQYPYEAKEGECRVPEAKSYSISGYEQINQENQSPEDLLKLLNKLTVAVAIEVQQDLMFYSSGVYKPKQQDCGDNLNHGVLLVGNKSDHFVIKNSWGPDWGEKGYFNMATYQQTEQGTKMTCGILNPFAVIPIVK